MILNNILSVILGSVAGVFPISLGAHFVFLQKINGVFYGKSTSAIGNDAMFVFYLSIFAAVLLIYHERVINLVRGIFDHTCLNDDGLLLLKELGICLIFYIPALLFNIFFENKGLNNAVMCIFICLNTVALFASDYINERKYKGKHAFLVPAISAFIGGLTGFSEIALVFLGCLLVGTKPHRAIRFSLLLYVPITLIKSVIYLIKACAGGFSLNFGLLILYFLLSFVTSFFLVSVLKKTAVKRNFRLFAYYMAFFVAFVIYTFIKG